MNKLADNHVAAIALFVNKNIWLYVLKSFAIGVLKHWFREEPEGGLKCVDFDIWQ